MGIYKTSPGSTTASCPVIELSLGYFSRSGLSRSTFQSKQLTIHIIWYIYVNFGMRELIIVRRIMPIWYTLADKFLNYFYFLEVSQVRGKHIALR